MGRFKLIRTKLSRLFPNASLVILLRLMILAVNLVTSSILARMLDYRGRSDVAVLVATVGISITLTTSVIGEEILRRKYHSAKELESEKVRLSPSTLVLVYSVMVLWMLNFTEISLNFMFSSLFVLYMVLATANGILISEHLCIHGILKMQILQFVHQSSIFMGSFSIFILVSSSAQNWLIAVIVSEFLTLFLLVRKRRNVTHLFRFQLSSCFETLRILDREELLERLSVYLGAMLIPAIVLILVTQNSNASLTSKFVIAISISTLVYLPLGAFFPLFISEANRYKLAVDRIGIREIIFILSLLLMYLAGLNILFQFLIPILYGDKYEDLVKESLVIIFSGCLLGCVTAISAYLRGLRDFFGGFCAVAISMLVFTSLIMFLPDTMLTLRLSLQFLILGLAMGVCFGAFRALVKRIS